jgi:RHS repeat-associated protein
MAAETGGSNEWSPQTYGYDSFGNRAVTASYIPTSSLTPTALAQFSNNQWWGSGVTYDAAGNQKTLPLRSFTYDAENRVIAATEPSTAAISYVYDGEGKRVQKTVGTSITTYVYDGFGNLAAEYASQATANGLLYRTVDALGSTRLLTDASRTALEWGVYPSNPDIESHKFTGKERDAETGMDWFEVRYMSSAQGGFTSPDPLVWQLWQNGSDDDRVKFQELISDPQNLNLYAYVRNNPLKYTDPTGSYYCNRNTDECSKIKAAYDQAKAAAANPNLSKDERTAINSTLKFLGKPGEVNGVVIAFGAVARGAVADTDTTKTFGSTITTITFDPEGLARYDANTLSETLIHEGTHGADEFPLGRNPITKSEEMATETHAYTNQSYAAEGLGVASRYGVWSPGMTDANRQKAIKDNAHKSTRIWCQSGGKCK